MPARLARPKTRRFFGSRRISGKRCDQPGTRCSRQWFGAPGVQGTFLRRRTKAPTVRQRKEQNCIGFCEYIYARALERLLIEKGHTVDRLDAQGQLFGGLAATNLEVGLDLHFGRKASFYRVLFENRFKQRNK